MVRAVDVGFYQRDDVIGFVFQMITTTLCREQRGQGLGMEREVGQEKLGNQVDCHTGLGEQWWWLEAGCWKCLRLNKSHTFTLLLSAAGRVRL